MRILIVAVLFLACGERDTKREAQPPDLLTEVAQSERLWTGVAVSKGGRLFVNYPRWFPNTTFSVAEILESGEVRRYPNEEWNDWEPSAPPADNFVCVQSVYVDRDDFLWILDPAMSIYHGGVIEGGPKLIKVDLGEDRVVQRINFDSSIAPPESYLNDVRVDTRSGCAYITDSGLGAIVVVDLSTGKSRRLLDDHPSVKSEDIVLTIEGEEWLRPDGSKPQIHSDGIALTRDGEYLYYQALTSRSMYRIGAEWLRDESISASKLGEKVEFVGKTGASDGIAWGPDGCVYLTSIEHNAIRKLTPDGQVEIVCQDPTLKWPDSIAVTDEGEIYVTTSQIHLISRQTEPYRVFRLQVSGLKYATQA